jgi:hypothetical protein
VGLPFDQQTRGSQQAQDTVERGSMCPCYLRQILTCARIVFQEVSDPELSYNVDTLGHLEALDQLLQHKLRREIIRGYVVPPLACGHFS